MLKPHTIIETRRRTLRFFLGDCIDVFAALAEGSVSWFIPYETIQSRDKDRPHPATFPPRLPEYCFRLHGLSRLSLVMDPFLGLGSTAVAAAQLGLDFIDVEMDTHYLAEAVARTKRALAG